MSLINHVEYFLGAIDDAWQSESGIKVAHFRDKPVDGVATYVTLGLSHHVLPMHGERTVREELVFSAYEKYPRAQIASFLLTFCDFVLSKHKALLRSNVIGPSDPIMPDVSLNAIYAAIPVVFDEGFATYSDTSPPTIFVWLIPLHGTEAKFVKKNGWSQFEDILEAKDPDLWDLNRDPVL
jgi:hypothetical protein